MMEIYKWLQGVSMKMDVFSVQTYYGAYSSALAIRLKKLTMHMICLLTYATHQYLVNALMLH